MRSASALAGTGIPHLSRRGFVCASAAGVGGGEVTLFLCGDVMTGRGIDQIMPEPVDPILRERYVTSAED